MHQSMVELASFEVGSSVSSFTCIHIIRMALIKRTMTTLKMVMRISTMRMPMMKRCQDDLELEGDEAAEELSPVPDQHHVGQTGQLLLNLVIMIMMMAKGKTMSGSLL